MIELLAQAALACLLGLMLGRCAVAGEIAAPEAPRATSAEPATPVSDESVTDPILEAEVPAGNLDAVTLAVHSPAESRYVRVTRDGSIKRIYTSLLSRKTASGRVLADSDRDKFFAALADLPPSADDVPPDDKALFVRVSRDGRSILLAYDRTRLPEAVLSVIRLIPSAELYGSAVASPSSEVIATLQKDLDAPYAVSPLGAVCIGESSHRRIVVRKLIPADAAGNRHETPSMVSRILDEQALHCDFSEDGTKLLVVTGKSALDAADRSLQVLDASTLEPIHSRQAPATGLTWSAFAGRKGDKVVFGGPEAGLFELGAEGLSRHKTSIPADTASRVFLSGDRTLAVIRTRDGRVLLWDEAAGRSRATLAEDAEWVCAKFSPDGRRVAVFVSFRKDSSGKQRPPLFVIRDVEDDTLHRRLLSYDVAPVDVLSIEWTANSRHVVASTRQLSLFTLVRIQVWNAENGRHVANLDGTKTWQAPGQPSLRFRIIESEQCVIACSKDGTVHSWNLKELGSR